MRFLEISAIVGVALAGAACSSTSSNDMSSNYGIPQLDTSAAAYLKARTNAPLDPNRKISDQDCTSGVSFEGGNLRCK